MADIPNCPRGREEEYLSDIAGLTDNAPSTPWSRKEAYLDAISGKMDNMEEQIAALATDISFKGSVATESDLPSGAAVGDAYITEDTGVMYVWTGEDWVALGGTGINVVQTTGTSTTDVMSQNAATSMVFADPSTKNKPQIGATSNAHGIDAIAIGHSAAGQGRQTVAIGSAANITSAGDFSTAIGMSATCNRPHGISIGSNASVTSSNTGYTGSIALGRYASAQGGNCIALGSYAGKNLTGTSVGIIDLEKQAVASTDGYNSSSYMLMKGLYDPQTAHDAATKGYVDGLVGNIESALHAINNGGNA